MPENKHDIIRRLRKDILPLQGYKPQAGGPQLEVGLGRIERAFPHGVFPTGAIHDFISQDEEDLAATSGFIAGIIGRLTERGGIAVWIGPSGSTFASGPAHYGIDPGRVIFVAPVTLKKALWVMEESLRCDCFIAVVGEIPELNLVQSRRLQLVVEQSRVTGFLLRYRARQKGPVASIAQWRVTAVPTQSQGDRPGRGFPRWLVEVLKIRNRRPISCEIEWTGEQFVQIPTQADEEEGKESKTG
jgi:protein ImuA